MCPAKVSDDEPPHPRETSVLFGHGEAEQTLLQAYRGGRMPHAWLIGGESGIGKATLAYRLARFVLANPDPRAPAVQKAVSLAVAEAHPAARRVACQSHADLLVLERVVNEKTGKLFTRTSVDQVRDSVTFFGSTAGEGGWRVAIVDPIDDLNKYGINALLKVLEEPPQRALLLLITATPGRALPTIRSRCRALMLRPLQLDDVAKAAAAAAAESEGRITAEIREAAAAADGSVGRALRLLDSDALELRRQIAEVLARLPVLDPRSLHALGEEISGTEAEPLAAFMDTVNAWLAGRLRDGPQQAQRLARIAEVWASVNKSGLEAQVYNLDRKPLVFSVLGQLADAARA